MREGLGEIVARLAEEERKLAAHFLTRIFKHPCGIGQRSRRTLEFTSRKKRSRDFPPTRQGSARIEQERHLAAAFLLRPHLHRYRFNFKNLRPASGAEYFSCSCPNLSFLPHPHPSAPRSQHLSSPTVLTLTPLLLFNSTFLTFPCFRN